MQYKDLNLKKIRQDCDLDFAHYTYKKGQCSCCYGPLDLPARYWKNGKIPFKYDPEYLKLSEAEKQKCGHAIGYCTNPVYTYILFKNANNGQGIVKANDEIGDYTCVSYRVNSVKQLKKICSMLQEQLGDSFSVTVPKDFKCCIEIRKIVSDK